MVTCTKITYSGEGDELPNGQYQDIVFIIEDKSKVSPIFKREGLDLHINLQIGSYWWILVNTLFIWMVIKSSLMVDKVQMLSHQV